MQTTNVSITQHSEQNQRKLQYAVCIVGHQYLHHMMYVTWCWSQFVTNRVQCVSWTLFFFSVFVHFSRSFFFIRGYIPFSRFFFMRMHNPANTKHSIRCSRHVRPPLLLYFHHFSIKSLSIRFPSISYAIIRKVISIKWNKKKIQSKISNAFHSVDQLSQWIVSETLKLRKK